MCQAMVNKKKDAKKAWDDAVKTRENKDERRRTYQESKDAEDTFISELQDYLKILGDYSSSLLYIGNCLKYVVINDEPFDKDKCIELATGMQNYKPQLEEILNDVKNQRDELQKDIEKLNTQIEELDEKIPTLKSTYEGINENSDCGSCSECYAKMHPSSSNTSNNTGVTRNTGGGGCFLAGTKVHTRDSLINIEDVKEGDYVLSYNFKDRKNVFNRVKQLLIHEDNSEDVYELTINSKILKVTEKHRFYVENELQYGWVEAKNLKVNDRVMLLTNKLYTIDKIEKHSHNGTVYNLEVENDHNYFVSSDGILVHNRKGAVMERL